MTFLTKLEAVLKNKDLPAKERGFSFPDLLVSISIMAILATQAIPQFSGFASSFDRFNARSYLIQDLKRAQAEAITQGCREIFTIATDGKSYSYGCDYLPYDTNSIPQADSISFTRHLPGNMTISADALIIFNSQGHAVDASGSMSNVNITLYDDSGPSITAVATGTLLGTGVFSCS